MILDDKTIMYPPSPAYLTTNAQTAVTSSPSPSVSTFSHATLRQNSLTIDALPAHILLQVIHHTFPPPAPSPSYSHSHFHSHSQPLDYPDQMYEDSNPERQRKALHYLSTSLRLVSKQLYTACMHILRSTYLPSYLSLVRPPYTSDPFPSTTTSSNDDPSSLSGPPSYSDFSASPPQSHSLSHANRQSYITPGNTTHRETVILDRFIALKVRQDVFADDTELHTDREDAFKDLFDVAQPRARLEDLVRVYGVREGVVVVPAAVRQGQRNSANSSVVSLPTIVPTPSSPSASLPTPSAQREPPADPKIPQKRRSLFSFLMSSPSPCTSSPNRSSSSIPNHAPSATSSPKPKPTPIPFSSLSVSFSPRRVGLLLNRSRTIAEIARTGGRNNQDTLEVLARKLVAELKLALGG